jgi:hypothetical protein
MNLENTLSNLEKKTQLLTFSKLYPNFLFPGKNQKRKKEPNTSFEALEMIHAYNPFHWGKVVRYINKASPKKPNLPLLHPFFGSCIRMDR